MIKRQRWGIVLAALLAVVLFLAGGSGYISGVQESFWMQSVADVEEVIGQGGHAFEVYVKKDMEMLHGLALNMSQKKSGEKSSIINRLQAFGGSEANYYVIDLDNRILYSSESEIGTRLSEEEMEAYERYDELSVSGMEEPYQSTDTGEQMLGYYESFCFTDGTRGIIWKEQPLSSIAAEFSLSFYDGRGLSYIVNRDGDILIRPGHENSRQDFQNVFDVMDADGNSKEAQEDFRADLAAGESGVLRFLYESEEYVYAYVPITISEGWYLISIIPNSVIMTQAERVMKSSQIFVFLLITAILVFAAFVILMRHNRKNVMEKELEIKYREQLFNILANNTEDVYVMFTTQGYEVEYISPNVERVLGIESKEVKNSLLALSRKACGLEETFRYEDLDQMKPGTSVEREVERIHKITGEHRWFTETVYRVIIDETDKFIVSISDRTMERQSKQVLEQALEIAKVANQSKSTFLNNMSHDIRTPMNAIVGLCTLLQRDADNPVRVREHTRKITASSQHLLGLINDVLDMSKIESGKTTLNITEINLADIVDDLGTIIQSQAKAKQQTFEISVVDVRAEQLLGDKLRINQILLNILSNAVKYTQVGGHVEMIIRQMPQTTKNYAALRFIIQDNGIGMAPDYIETIFQPFTREINSTTNKIQGTGLGMAITKSLVELMGGTISVESEQGKGSTFTVDLELRMQEQKIDQDFWKKYGVTQTLIVDDEAEVCTGIISAMAGTGVSLQFALDGLSAIQMVERAHRDGRDFNLVLIDWKMPDMDGIETARRIREILPSDIPIMILTAYDWSEIEEEALAAGIDGFLPKPFFLSNFKQTIEKLNEKKGTDSFGRTSTSVLYGKHILAAEDIDLNAEILVELLDMVGATCDVAVNGKEVLERFEQSEPGQYDLILMDVQMPVMNGYEAVKAIRACSHPMAKSIPVIAMTADAFAEDIKNAMDAGMNAHVAKPIDFGRLEAAVQSVFVR